MRQIKATEIKPGDFVVFDAKRNAIRLIVGVESYESYHSRGFNHYEHPLITRFANRYKVALHFVMSTGVQVHFYSEESEMTVLT
jgi:hypothetical protein